MASITHFQDVLQKQWFQKIKFIGEYLRQEDLTEAAAAAKYRWRDRLWPPMPMLWAFLVQVLHPGWSGAAAVAEVLAEHAAAGQPLEASADPSAYCQARKHVPESIYRHALGTVGQRLQTKVGEAYRWCGRRVWVVDGSHCSMPDTPELQAAFPVVHLFLAFPFGCRSGQALVRGDLGSGRRPGGVHRRSSAVRFPPYPLAEGLSIALSISSWRSWRLGARIGCGCGPRPRCGLCVRPDEEAVPG